MTRAEICEANGIRMNTRLAMEPKTRTFTKGEVSKTYPYLMNVTLSQMERDFGPLKHGEDWD